MTKSTGDILLFMNLLSCFLLIVFTDTYGCRQLHESVF